jgi:hypothetical protein
VSRRAGAAIAAARALEAQPILIPGLTHSTTLSTDTWRLTS